MRAAIVIALLASACAHGPSVEERLRTTEVMLGATCQRFEEYQRATGGKVTHPCRQQDGHATITTVYMRGDLK